ncbi:MAG TPA: ATP-binding cassette domain-containing protein, partial [bacterium]|nr:ATP-binding cassette domain-containing protein [bacterium]
MIRVENLHLRYCSEQGEVHAVRGLNLTVKKGEFYTLLGPSGCGKTTTLRCVAGLETPEKGEIIIGDELVFSSEGGLNVPTYRRQIGMVFQSYAIWPHLS